VIRDYLVSGFADNLVRAARERELTDGMFVLEHMMELLTDLRQMRLALREYLADPAEPEKINVDPRAWEFDVVYHLYLTGGNGKTSSSAHKDSLENLMARVNNYKKKIAPADPKKKLKALYQRIEVKKVTWRGSDPRQLLLNTIDSTAKQLQLWLNAQEGARDIHAEEAVRSILSVLVPVLIEATDGNPELRAKIEEIFAVVREALLGL
jgi:hypothetical protein